jgi:hypothetical protein
MKKFGVNEAKAKFVYPLVEIFRGDTRSPLAAVEERFFRGTPMPNPFSGLWPTRIIIFRAPNFERVFVPYFGKRTRRFDAKKLFELSERGVYWLEFDRDSLVQYYEFRRSARLWNANLARYYYSGDGLYTSGLGVSRYGISNVYSEFVLKGKAVYKLKRKKSRPHFTPEDLAERDALMEAAAEDSEPAPTEEGQDA